MPVIRLITTLLCVLLSLSAVAADKHGKARRTAAVADVTRDGEPNILSSGVFVLDATSGQTLFAKNAEHAKNAKVHGSKLRYEDQPHKDTLGFWVQQKDWAEWTFELPNEGKFDVFRTATRLWSLFQFGLYVGGMAAFGYLAVRLVK